MTNAEMLRRHANLAIKEGGIYYSGEYMSRIATMAEILEAENARLRELIRDMYKILSALDIDYCGACPQDSISHPCPRYTVYGGDCKFETAMRELGVEGK